MPKKTVNTSAKCSVISKVEEMNNFYFIPTIRTYHELEHGTFNFVYLEVVWLKWALSFPLKEYDENSYV